MRGWFIATSWSPKQGEERKRVAGGKSIFHQASRSDGRNGKQFPVVALPNGNCSDCPGR